MNFSVDSARPAAAPRTVSATSRHFCGEMRAYMSFAVTSAMCVPLGRGLDLLVARVRLERARRSELAELVAHHVFADQHGHVLATVVDSDRETDHLRHHHRTARPGLDGLAVVLRGSHLHLLREVQVDERALLQ